MGRRCPPGEAVIVVQADPFDHSVVDDMWDGDMLRDCRSEMPQPSDPRWRRFSNTHERKLGGSDDMFGPRTAELMAKLSSAELCAELQSKFGIGSPLTMSTYGGGYHLIEPGGFLDVHVDFNRAENGLYRRLNLLIYLNDTWDGGALELSSSPDGEVTVIAPAFNRTVIFATSDVSWHGPPKPTVGYWRRSIAAYYFSKEPPPNYGEAHDTVFV